MSETNASTALETKLVQLQLTTKRTDGILEKSEEEPITRHQGTLRTIIGEVETLRLTVEAEKLGRKEDTAEWSEEIDAKISEADSHVRLTKEWLAENKKKLDEIEKEEKIKFEVRLHETKVKLQDEHVVKNTSQTSKTMIGMQAKLPKLVISKFNGSPMDWPRFWGQFSENIDQSNIAPVTKFSYLRELLEPKVRQTIEALPFHSEGYNRAISILKGKFGKESEIVKSYTREILGLPTIQTANHKKIHEFSEKLSYCVQALQTLNKLEGVNGAVPMTLDKLPCIRGDLVRTDSEWENWTFAKLVEALNQWCRRNPIDKTSELSDDSFSGKRREKLFHVSRQRLNPRNCVYCDSGEHKTNDCTKVMLTSARKQILAKKRLCFNCAAGNHKASECPSKATCRKCEKRHHTSICDSHDNKNDGQVSNVAMTTRQKSEAVFPVVVVQVNGIRCRALIDSGAGSSYVSAKLINLLQLKPSKTLIKNIDMLMASKSSKLEIYDLKFDSLDGSFSLPVKATKVNKSELLLIDNPNYSRLINKHPHLAGVAMNDDDVKETLPIHVILGSGEYSKIKTQARPRIGDENAPIAELTKFGWFLMGPGYEFESNVMLLTQTSHAEYEELCRLDVLGLEDTSQHDQSVVFDEFKEQLTRSPEGWYETALPWKPNHPYLPSNKRGSLKRLESLTRRLKRENLMEKYDAIIQEQLAEGVIERVLPPAATGSDPIPPPVAPGSDLVLPPVATGSDPIPPPVVTGSDLVPPPVATGSDPIPPPVVTGSDLIPPPVVTGSDPIPPPVVTGSDPIPPPVVTGSDPILPPVATGSDLVPPPVVTGRDPIPPPVAAGSGLVLPPVVTESNPALPPVATGSTLVPPPVVTGSDPVPPPVASGSDAREFYVPHRYVVRESAQTTKMRIVYDASARETPESPSLNDCLYAGPALQNKLWDVLVQQRAFPVVISGDIKQAFLQVRVRKCERDVLRFHWRSNANEEIQTYRFTRVLFGLAPSPFLLGGVLECHLDSWSQKYPEDVERLRRSLYVDDALSGGQNTTEAKQRKTTAIEIMDDGKFTLHKWNSNVPELEDKNVEICDEQSFAKQQLQVEPGESKLLGLKWDKTTDTISVEFPASTPATTKRELLASLAKIYDPLGLASPITLQGKLVFRDVCDSRIGWDSNLPDNLQKRWLKFERSLPKRISIPRPLAPYHEPVVSAELHVFGDASTEGVGTVVYSVIRQAGGVTTSLVAAKSRLAKKNLTVPRLELVSAHMSANLVTNAKNALIELPAPAIFGWLDSTVALHWLLGNGQYKQFVANRVRKIREHTEIQWRYVPTEKNPADIASRGGQVADSSWLTGPDWLADRDRWPENRVAEKSPASEVEAKVVKEVLSLAHERDNDFENTPFENLLQRHDLLRTLRIIAWVRRFTTNRHRRGPLTSDDIREVRDWWTKREQARDSLKPHFEHTKRSLNLVENEHGILECRGRIHGHYPIYLPANSEFTRKLVQRYHVETLHGGVGLTMAAVREIYWVPTLRRLVKAVRSKCYGCKRFTATSIVKPTPGMLPKDRTTGGTAFEVIGTDFAGPIRYKRSNKRESKSYLVIFSCSLSRAIHLELIKNLETTSFIPCLKRLIARRGRPRIIYSDNGATFVKASKWLKQIRNDERVQGLLQQYDVSWKFNLSRAPWWGGQFERLIGVMKNAMYKVIGGATLTWSELSDVLLDVEIQINRRPLSYMEDDVELPTLTPCTFLFQRTSELPESEPWRIDDQDLRKRAKYLTTCKNSLWKRWQREYLTALRERHSLVHKTQKYEVKEGDAVIVKTDDKNRGRWPLAIVEKLFPGSDGRTRAVQLKTKNGVIERPVQHLYPLELQCDVGKNAKKAQAQLNPDARAFLPKRAAAADAQAKITAITEYEEDI